MDDILIKKGQRVKLSEVGHRGFFYPQEEEATVLYDVSASRLSWVGSREKKPVTVPENSVFVSGSPDKKIVVWA